LLFAVAGTTGAGCTSPPADGRDGDVPAHANDPAEPVNRAVFAANLVVDHTLIQPVAAAYRNYLPAKLRGGIHNIITNLKEPKIAANDLLQVNFAGAGSAALRLAVNTTIGLGGIIDVAAGRGWPPGDADFGETLAVWRIGDGPFVELPGLGPSNLRDSAGTVVDLLFGPMTAIGGPVATSLRYASGAAGFLDRRSAHLRDLDELERTSIDYYATLRSVSRQRRGAEIAAAKRDSLLYRDGLAAAPEGR
jgi:phospholipid-binding lipoprotein MlaA